MAQRRSLPKGLRFEVFKRDKFRCQYCGRAAPDVVLEVDHIIPIAEGGRDELMNLVTSCRDCNRGKGRKLLDDHTTLQRQRAEMEEQQDRLEQLEMLAQWREELRKRENAALDLVINAVNDRIAPFAVNDTGRKYIARCLQRFGFEIVLESVDIAASTYLARDDEGNLDRSSVELMLEKIGGIAYNKKRAEDDPLFGPTRKLAYIAAKKLSFVDRHRAASLFRSAMKCGAQYEDLLEIISRASSWTNLQIRVEDWIDDHCD